MSPTIEQYNRKITVSNIFTNRGFCFVFHFSGDYFQKHPKEHQKCSQLRNETYTDLWEEMEEDIEVGMIDALRSICLIWNVVKGLVWRIGGGCRGTLTL